MKRRAKHQAHDNDERWLLTYSDLITLLLGLFVILYSISKVDAGKYAEISSALNGVFGSPTGVLTGAPAMLGQQIDERREIANELEQALNPEGKQIPISVSTSERGVTVHIMEELLFASGNADLKQASLPAIDTLAGVLRRLRNDLRVEGHTDNVPISTPQFPSNWHLSVARALNVAYYLIQRHGLTQERVSVVGYSEYRPLVPNDSPANRSRNRRVDIVILTPGAGQKTTPASPTADAGRVPASGGRPL
jgi:chemotaxis protein MotB